jgi:hypothetical protein
MSVDALLFAPDRAAAASELRRIVRPGGRVMFTSWDYHSQPVGRPPQVNDHRPLLSDSGFEVLAYDETDDWQRRLAETAAGLMENVEELAAESGVDVAGLRASIEEMRRHLLSGAQARTRYRCNTQAMSATQSRDRSGRWPRGTSGNPGGRPLSLAKATRALVGEDGMALVQLWWDIARDESRRDRDRLEASKLLADRGWGKAATYEPQEGDPFDLARMEQAAQQFDREVRRLAEFHRRNADP